MIRKTLAAAAAVAITLGVATLAASPANAATSNSNFNTVTAAVACAPYDGWTITWTIQNVSGDDESITSSPESTLVPSQGLLNGATKTVTQNVSTDAQQSLTIHGTSSLIGRGQDTGYTPVFPSCGNVDVTALAPATVAAVCDDSGALTGGGITITATPNVNYFIDNQPAVAGFNAADAGPHTVTATADDGYTLTGDSTFPVTVGAGTCGTLPTHASFTTAAVASNPTCTTSHGSITVTEFPGFVTYSINGTPVTSATTSEAPGTYAVTAVATTGNTVTQASWNLTIAPLASNCGAVDSLALTGTNNAGGFIAAASILMLLGSALVIWGRRRARNAA